LSTVHIVVVSEIQVVQEHEAKNGRKSIQRVPWSSGMTTHCGVRVCVSPGSIPGGAILFCLIPSHFYIPQ
jgi:hypothetical protein